MDLALTLDYELFGDGSGDVLREVIHPTDRLLRICHLYGVKLTIFFEVAEYWKLKEVFLGGQCAGYSYKLMEKQIIEAYREGHDIQLHIHPQWLHAEYTDQGWRVDKGLWRLSSIGSSSAKVQGVDLQSVLAKGKETLEGIIEPIDPQYECQVLRAGGLNVQPSSQIVQAMRSVALKADSSILPGGVANADCARYDYTMVNNQIPFWATDNDNLLDMVTASPEGGNHWIYELPIFSLPLRRIRKYDIHRLRVKLANKYAMRTTRTQVRSKTKKENKLRFLLETESVMWDFCLLSYSKMRWFLSKAIEIHRRSKYAYHPFVLIGHSKEFVRPKAFERFLSYTMDSTVPVEFVTLTEVLRRIEQVQSGNVLEERAIG